MLFQNLFHNVPNDIREFIPYSALCHQRNHSKQYATLSEEVEEKFEIWHSEIA